MYRLRKFLAMTIWLGILASTFVLSAPVTSRTQQVPLRLVGSYRPIILTTENGVQATSSAAGVNSVDLILQATKFSLPNYLAVNSSKVKLSSSANPSVYGQPVTLTAAVSDFSGNGTPTGVVIFKDGGTTIAIREIDQFGNAVFYSNTLTAGLHSITAIYGSDSIFNPGPSSTLAQTVNKANASTTIATSGNPSVFGQTVTFTATVAAEPHGAGIPSGTVTFKDGATTLGTGTLDASGKAAFTTSTLAVTSHSITANYPGDSNFSGSPLATLVQAVNKANATISIVTSSNPSVFGQPVTIMVAVTAASPSTGIPSGLVTFRDGTNTVGTGMLDALGRTVITAPALAVTSHLFTANYPGDVNFNSSPTATLAQTVNKADTSLAIASSANPSVFGQPVTITAAVTVKTPGAGKPTGTVTFKDGATTLGAGTLDTSGKATFTVSSLTASSHSITTSYLGDGNFNISQSATLAQTVSNADTSTVIAASSASSVFGQPVTITATVTVKTPGSGKPTGAIKFKDGEAILGSVMLDAFGKATLTASALAAVPHSITALYEGDINFNTSQSAILVHTVNKAETSIAIVSSSNPSVFGQPVTITATVTAKAPGAGKPTGAVTFKDGTVILGVGALDETGKATFVASTLAVASHPISANYSGDTNFNANGSPSLAQTVSKADSTTAIVSSVASSVCSQSVTFTATVAVKSPGAGAPTGTVTFKDGATTLGAGTLDASGKAIFTVSALAVASHSITATYSGNNNIGSSSSVLTQVVNKADTSTLITGSASPSVFGQPVTITAMVAVKAPGVGTPTGAVTFKDGATTLGTGTLDASGKAIITTAALAVASHSITAVYAGSGCFNANTSPTFGQVVDRADTSTAILSSGNPSVFGQPITITATVTVKTPGAGKPTGTVTFKDGATTLGAGTLDASSKASFITSALAIASHSITAHYEDAANFNASQSSILAQAVNKADTSTAIASSGTPSVFGQPRTITATVTVKAPGAGKPTGMVTFKDGAATLGTGTLDTSGKATFTAPALAVASHSITALYEGDIHFNVSSSPTLVQTVNKADTSTAIISSSNPSVFGQSVTITATVTVKAPGAGATTGTVTFKDGSTTLGAGTLDASGKATFTTSTLTVATHSITANYSGDASFNASSSTSLAEIVSKADSITTVASSAASSVCSQLVTFTATVAIKAPGAGTPVGTVTFKDGATTLGTGTLDASGKATLTASALTVASHPITAVYGGNNNISSSSSAILSQLVNKADSETIIKASANPSVFGQSAAFTATVTAIPPGAGTPTGTVTFKDGATTLGAGTLDASGKVAITTASLAVASHSITATYSGNACFNANTSLTFGQTVNKADTSTLIASSANPSELGISVTFTAKVTVNNPGAGAPTGIVTFKDGATTLGAGKIIGGGTTSLTTSTLIVDSHTVTAVYEGDGNFNGGSSAALAQTVQVFRTKFFSFPNRTDSLLARAETANGETIEYFGNKDERGLATALTSVRLQGASGESTIMHVDDSARPSQILTPNGEIYQFDWQASGGVQVTATTGDRSAQISFFMPPVGASSMSDGGVGTNLKVPADGNSYQTEPTLAEQPSLANDLFTKVTLTQCGGPVRDAFVEMRVKTIGGVFTFSERTFIGQRITGDPEGVYRIRIPQSDIRINDLMNDKCVSFAKAIAKISCAALPKQNFADPYFCSLVSAAAIELAIPPTASFVGCEFVLAALRLYCSSPARGAPNLGGMLGLEEILCAARVDQLFDPFSTALKSTLYVNGKEQKSYIGIPTEDQPFDVECKPVTFTVTPVGFGSGRVLSSPGGINCGAKCSDQFTAPIGITLTAIKSDGSEFGGWQGNCRDAGIDPNGNPTAIVRLPSEVLTCSPRFDLVKDRTLTVTKSGNGKGVVASPQNEIRCDEACQGKSVPFPVNNTVTLVAQEAPGNTFKGWSGDCSGTSRNVSVNLSANKRCTVEFAAPSQPTLSVALAPITVPQIFRGDTLELKLRVRDEKGQPVNGVTITPPKNLCFSPGILPTDRNGETLFRCVIPESAIAATYELSFGPASQQGYLSSGTVSSYITVQDFTLSLEATPTTPTTVRRGDTFGFKLTVKDDKGRAVDDALILVADPICNRLGTLPRGVYDYGCTAPFSTGGPYNITFGPAAKAGYISSKAVTRQVTVCDYDISPTSAPISSAGGNGSFRVIALNGCSWSASVTDGNGFIAIIGNGSGSGNGEVRYSVTANPTQSQRSGTITVAGKTFTITQAALVCTLSIFPSSRDIFDSGSISSFSVSSPASCGWSALSDSFWLTFVGGNRGSASGSVTYSASENNISSTRYGAITVFSDQNPQARTVFSVTQSGCSAYFRDSGRDVDSGFGGGSASVSTTTSRCPWTASENSDWLSLGTSSGTGNGSVTFSFSANPSSFSRSAIISIGNSTFVLTQRGRPLLTPTPTPRPQ